MELDGTVSIVTGGAGGVGSALARHVVAAGGRVAVADRDGPAAAAVAAALDAAHPGIAIAVAADVTRTGDLGTLIDTTEAAFGPIDVFFANAGVEGAGGVGDDDAGWEQALEVNLLAHVRAARLLLPGWLRRGSGYFVTTASAAGLLTQIGSAPYSVTKHAAVAFAEWLSVTYGGRGVRVSCLCPMGVDTAMLASGEGSADARIRQSARVVQRAGEVLSPDVVARSVIDGIGAERFLVLPHAEVAEYYRRRATDTDRWLDGMRRLQDATADPAPLS